MSDFSRRTALSLALGLWAKAADQVHNHAAPPSPSGTYNFRFLSPAEKSTIQRYAALLIPPTSRSGGAPAARVEEYIDTVLALAAPSLQRSWRRSLAEWAKATNPLAVLERTSRGEFSPRTRDEQFFVLFKSATTAAFYTSQEGIEKELGYQGMSFLRDFPGWQGEPFTTPADYRPLLKSRS